MKLTQVQILKNRIIATEYLLTPGLKKTIGMLGRAGGSRCCLGHMCDALNVPKSLAKNPLGNYYVYGKIGETNSGFLPKSVMESLGMYTRAGCSGNNELMKIDKFAEVKLTKLNDETSIRPQQIGQYLKDNILGGDRTPWKKLKITKAKLAELYKEYNKKGKDAWLD